MAFDPSQPSEVVAAPTGGFDPSQPSTVVAAPDPVEAGRQAIASLNDPSTPLPATAAQVVAKSAPYLNSSAIVRDAKAFGSALFGNDAPPDYLANESTFERGLRYIPLAGPLFANAGHAIGDIASSAYDKAGADYNEAQASLAAQNKADPGNPLNPMVTEAKALIAGGTGLATGAYNTVKPVIAAVPKIAGDVAGDAFRGISAVTGDPSYAQDAALQEAGYDLDRANFQRNYEQPALKYLDNLSGLPNVSQTVASAVPLALPAVVSLETAPLAARAGNYVTDALTPDASIVPVTPAVATSTGDAGEALVHAAAHVAPHGFLLRAVGRAAQSLVPEAAEDAATGLQGVSTGPKLAVPYVPAAQQAAEADNLASNLSQSTTPSNSAIAAGQLAGAGVNAGGSVLTGGLYGLAGSNPGEEEESTRQGAGFGAAFSPVAAIAGGFARQNIAETAKNAELVKAGQSRSTGTDLVSPDKANVINGLQGTFAGAKTPEGNPIRYVVQKGQDYADAANAANNGQVEDAANSRGFFDAATGKIHLNADDPDLLGTLHETSHAVASALSGIDTQQAEALNQSIAKSSLQNGNPTPNFQRFIDQYNGGKPVDWAALPDKAPDDNPNIPSKEYYLNEVGAQTGAQLSDLTNPAKAALPPELSDVVFNALGDYARKIGLRSSPNILDGIGDSNAAPVPADPAALQASRQAFQTIAAQPRSGLNLIPDATPARSGTGYQFPTVEPKPISIAPRPANPVTLAPRPLEPVLPPVQPTGLGIAARPLNTTPLAARPFVPEIGPAVKASPTIVSTPPAGYGDAYAIATAPKKNGGLGLSKADATAKIGDAVQAGATNAESILFHVQQGRLPDARTATQPVPANLAEDSSSLTEPVNRFTDPRPEPTGEPRDKQEVSNQTGQTPVQPAVEGQAQNLGELSDADSENIPTNVPNSTPNTSQAESVAHESKQTPLDESSKALGTSPDSTEPEPDAPANFSQADIDRIRQQVASTHDYADVKKPNKATLADNPNALAERRAKSLSDAQFAAVAAAHGEVAPNDGRVQMRTNPLTGQRTVEGNRFVGSDPYHQHLIEQANLTPEGKANLSAVQKAIASGSELNFDYLSADTEGTGATGTGRAAAQKASTASQRAKTDIMGPGVQEADKSFFPTGLNVSQDGNIIAHGFSPDKLIANAERTLNYMKDRGDKSLPFTNVNDHAFIQGYADYARNQSNGWKGDGSSPLKGTDAFPVSVTPGYEGRTIPREQADFFNLVTQGKSESAKTTKGPFAPNGQAIRDFATANGLTLDSATNEVNALRAQVNANGDFTAPDGKGGQLTGTKGILETPVENNRVDLISNLKASTGDPAATGPEGNLRAQGARFSRGQLVEGGLPNSRVASAGFLPARSAGATTGEEIARQFPSAKAFGDSLLDSEAYQRPPNNVDAPDKEKPFVPGQLHIDKYGANPFVYQAQYIDPKVFKDNLKLEGQTYEQVVNFPTTQKYIEWYKEGHEPPPIDVVKRQQDGSLYSNNRRRVVAALESGVKQIPALVEIGRRDDIWDNAHPTANKQP